MFSFTNGATYTIFYPGANSYLCPVAGGNISYVANPVPLTVTQSGSNYSLSYNGVIFNSWPSSYYVLAPANPGAGQYFVMTPVGGVPTTAAATSPGPSVLITQGTFSGFPWKTFNASSNVVLNFTANVERTDLTIGLRYSATNCVEIVVGGWFNSRSVVRDVNYSTGISVLSEYPATSPSPPIQQLNTAIKFVLTIANGTLTIRGTLPNGSTYTALTYTSPFINKTFTGYSFRGCPPYNWTVSADSLGSVSATTITYMATSNGYSATSSVSQADADLRARLAWLNGKISTGAIIDKQINLSSSWRPISNSVVGNLRLTFRAVGNGDLWIGFRASDGSFFYITFGGWGNTQSAITICNSSGTQVSGGGVTPGTLPSIIDPVTYTLTIMNGQLLLTALFNGVTSTRITYSNPALLGRVFTAYSFGAFSTTAPWKVTEDVVSVNAFTSTQNGYSAQSTVSQADADAKAIALWSSAITTMITNSKNVALNQFNTFNSALSPQVIALSGARSALKNVAINISGFTGKLPWE